MHTQVDYSVKAEALDLSKRRDSVETRNTPSPYNTSKSNEDSPNSRSPELNRSVGPYMGDSLFYDVRFASLPGIPRSSRNPDFNQSISPSREPAFTYPPPTLSPFLLQSATMQQELQAKLLSNKDLQVMLQQQSKPVVVPTESKPAVPVKAVRPFKAYPQGPHSICGIDIETNPHYNDFRKRMLEQIHAANGGQPNVSNPKMRRISAKSDARPSSVDCMSDSSSSESVSAGSKNAGTPTPDLLNNNVSRPGDEKKDTAYFERRRKNNAAAKKSRDRRRQKEDEIAIRASFLERENFALKIELEAVKKQLKQMEQQLESQRLQLVR